MNTYGDTGNVIALRRRLEWRGYHVDVVAVEPGTAFSFEDADIVFGGGGQDSGQLRVADDLVERGAQLRAAVRAGLPLLAVCGLYQLLGDSFIAQHGHHVPGVGVFQVVTSAAAGRLIGNIRVETAFGELVGFENHSGRTVLGPDQQPLGRVISGFGNDATSGAEGARSHHAIGTYLHGPLLPKNPLLTDHLIATALHRRKLRHQLPALDDRLERAAHAAAAKRRE